MDSGKVLGKTHTVTAADVTATTIGFNFGDFMQVEGVTVQVKTAAGADKAWNGATVVAGGLVTVDNTGATDWAATDVITVLAHS